MLKSLELNPDMFPPMFSAIHECKVCLFTYSGPGHDLILCISQFLSLTGKIILIVVGETTPYQPTAPPPSLTMQATFREAHTHTF